MSIVLWHLWLRVILFHWIVTNVKNGETTYSSSSYFSYGVWLSFWLFLQSTAVSGAPQLILEFYPSENIRWHPSLNMKKMLQLQPHPELPHSTFHRNSEMRPLIRPQHPKRNSQKRRRHPYLNMKKLLQLQPYMELPHSSPHVSLSGSISPMPLNDNFKVWAERHGALRFDETLNLLVGNLKFVWPAVGRIARKLLFWQIMNYLFTLPEICRV